MSEPNQANIEQFDYDVDLLQAILWQYDQAVHLLSLVDQKQAWYDINQTQFWQDWFNYVFWLANPDMTTNPDKQDIALFGLAVWSIILNVPLFVPLETESSTKPIWGFNAFDPTFPTLENSYWNFFGETGSGGTGANFSTSRQVTQLNLAEQQFLLMLKYFKLITRDNVMSLKIFAASDSLQHLPFYACSINDFLNYLCSILGANIGFTGRVFAKDNLNMTMTYIFTTTDFPLELFNAIGDLDLWPRPAAVGVNFITDTGTIFGLGQYNQNFTNGNFILQDF